MTLSLLAVAALGQVRVWSSGRGLWLDELSIAINLRERSLAELAGPLDYYQVAPVGWLLVGKVLREGLGEHELVLRAPSLVAGLLLLVLCLIVARRAIGGWAAAAAVGLVGLSPTILYYSGELKQYAVEATVALALLLMGDALGRRGPDRPSHARLAGWAALGAALLTLSYSGLVVLAGVTAGIAVQVVARRDWGGLLPLALTTAPGLLVGTVLAWHRRSLPMAPGQDIHFPTGMPAADGVGAWLPRMWTAFVDNPLAWHSAGWTLALLLGGLVALVVRGRYHWAAMFAGVLALAVVAAVLRGLPLADRVALYLVAPVILLVVAGLDGLARGIVWLGARLPRSPAGSRTAPVTSRAASVAVAAVVVSGVVAAAGPGLREGIAEASDPRNRDLGREVLTDLGTRLRPGDVVIAYWFSDQLVRWYGPEAGVEIAGRVRLYPSQDAGDCRPESVDAMLAGAARVWYLHGARASDDPADYTLRVVRELATRGAIVADRGALSTEPGWVLIDLTSAPDRAPPAVAPDPRLDCLSQA